MHNNVKVPWSIQIEFVEGCSRLCGFCGLNGIRSKPGNFKHMEVLTAERLAKQLAEFMPKARVEFAMHGEPTMHPKYLELIRIFRKALPKTQLQITTNGVRLLKRENKACEDIVKEMFMAGIDFMILDTYYPERDELQAKAEWIKKQKNGIDVIHFYNECQEMGISPWHNHHRRLQNTIIVMDDLAKHDGEVKSRVIVNHAGNNPSKDKMKEPLQKRCTLPFREISVCWNGDVNLCCQDWKHEYVVDNINHTYIRDIWSSKRFEAARAFLANKNRNLKPCNVCDIGSGSRSGLISKYPQPTPEQIRIVKGAK